MAPPGLGAKLTSKKGGHFGPYFRYEVCKALQRSMNHTISFWIVHQFLWGGKVKTKKLSRILLISFSCIVMSGCWWSKNNPPDDPPHKIVRENHPRLVKANYEPNQITQQCDDAIKKTEERLNAIVKRPEQERTIENTLLEFENTIADFSDLSNPLTFMAYVSTNEELSNEGSACEEKISTFFVQVLARRDLYQAIKKHQGRTDAEKRLVELTLRSFEQNGMGLDDQQLEQFVELSKELATKTTAFSKNLNTDSSSILASKEELEGLPESVFDRLKQTEGKYIVAVNEANYPVVMENCKNEQTRYRMLFAYLNRGGNANTKLLEEAVVLRNQMAKLLIGPDKTWADYKMTNRMAKDRKTVENFLNGLKTKLAQRNRDDLNQLLDYKKQYIDPQATQLVQWDIAYLNTQLKKQSFSIDPEIIREYFPAHKVVAGLFQVYSEMLGVHYEEVTNATTWAPEVKLYKIIDSKDQTTIGYFYADFYPRPLKYGHAAAFSLVSGRFLGGETYSLPISAIVANFTPPSPGLPALLSHDDVETLFHEFGHIMHQTLTLAPYASISGTSVAQDFVEAPSQMLENWVWQPSILKLISGHYKDESQSLPPDLLEKMILARDYQQGYFYSKQLLYGLFDFNIHTTNGPVNVNQVYDEMFRSIIGVEPIPGGQFPASFGHLMGGYDAGYYGYLWSKVYAQDMFSQFKVQGIRNPEIGGRYRKIILEKGNLVDAIDLLRNFLGRDPSDKPFLEELGIQ